VLAYSSISQMGVIAAVLGMGLAAADKGTALVAFYAAHHVLVKGALFLAIGVAAASSPRRLWRVLPPAAVLALSLGGLPLTGGALAKLAVKTPLGDGVVGSLATVSAAGTTLLMLHFLRRLARGSSQNARAAAPARLALPWLAMALASILVPWLLYLAVRGRPCRRCTFARGPSRGALAGFDRRRASPRLVALGEPPAARSRRRYYRSVGGRLPR
jgi:formate hydrogenlyase subunit 3/multisubunit Na+/H+ antiporter MnhD subunit